MFLYSEKLVLKLLLFSIVNGHREALFQTRLSITCFHFSIIYREPGVDIAFLVWHVLDSLQPRPTVKCSILGLTLA